LKPQQALEHMKEAVKRVNNLSVVGIAGPGDPFANPNETLETLELVRVHYPEKLLCVSSNGLNILDYIPRLAALNVSHVTITMNAVDPKVGADIYEWIYFDGKSYFGVEGAGLLLQRQTEAVRQLKRHGIIVKINTVVIPRINEAHVAEVSRYVSELGADIQNCIPLLPVKGTPFAQLDEPSASNMRIVRAKASIYIRQMTHCRRCRADAAGLLGNDLSRETANPVVQLSVSFASRPYIAIASTDGVSVNQHLGRASFLSIYRFRKGKADLVEQRDIRSQQDSENRWESISAALSDTAVLLVSSIGATPLRVLTKSGIVVEAVSGEISEILNSLFNNKQLPAELLRLAGHCSEGSSCSRSIYNL
jgi:nitrogen fixation protein NifB